MTNLYKQSCMSFDYLIESIFSRNESDTRRVKKLRREPQMSVPQTGHSNQRQFLRTGYRAIYGNISEPFIIFISVPFATGHSPRRRHHCRNNDQVSVMLQKRHRHLHCLEGQKSYIFTTWIIPRWK